MRKVCLLTEVFTHSDLPQVWGVHLPRGSQLLLWGWVYSMSLTDSLFSRCDPDLLQCSFCSCGGRSEVSAQNPCQCQCLLHKDIFLMFGCSKSSSPSLHCRGRAGDKGSPSDTSTASMPAPSQPPGRSQNVKGLGSKAPQSAPGSCCDSSSPGETR